MEPEEGHAFCGSVSGAAFWILPVLYFLGVLEYKVLLVSTLAASVVGTTFWLGFNASLSQLVAPDDVVEANSRLLATYAVTGVGGSVLAGVLCDVVGAPIALGIDAMTFAVSFLTLRRVYFRPAEKCNEPPRVGAFGALRRGLFWMLSDPQLRVGCMMLFLNQFVAAGFLDLVVFSLRAEMGASNGTAGLVLAVGGVGLFLGSTVAPGWVAVFRMRICFPWR